MHKHTHMHTNMHTHAYKHMYTHTHTHTHTRYSIVTYNNYDQIKIKVHSILYLFGESLELTSYKLEFYTGMSFTHVANYNP